MILIDGSQGEGGGQILRSSLALSMALGKPFRITNIRANRSKPGLMRQHLTAVEAAAAICSARVHGASAGSRELSFEPGAVRGGNFHFTIGTAGSTTLVLQAVLPTLLFAREPSEIVVEGGTHARGAPPFEFLERALVPILNRLGPRVEVMLERHGFYPAGGGRIRVRVEPTSTPRAIDLDAAGTIAARDASVLLAGLPSVIAEREFERIGARLGWEIDRSRVTRPENALSPGNAVILEIRCEHSTEVCCAIGEQGKSAERVADEAIDQAREFLAGRVAVGTHLADQLMVPFAVAAARSGSVCSFRTLPLSSHAVTNAATVELFLPGATKRGTDGSGVCWSVGPSD